MYGSSWLAGIPPAMAVAAGMSAAEDKELWDSERDFRVRGGATGLSGPVSEL